MYLTKNSIEFKLENPEDASLLFGVQDKYLKLVESQLSVEINYRGEMVQIIGPEKLTRERARKALQALQVLVSRGVPVHASDVIIAIKMVLNDDIENFTALYEIELTKDAAGKPIRLKNLIQKTYVDSVKQHDIVFGIVLRGQGKLFWRS